MYSFASLAATALALASVTPLKRVPEPVEIDELNLVDHLLGPLTTSLELHARKAASEAVALSIAARERIEPKAPEFPVTAGAASEAAEQDGVKAAEKVPEEKAPEAKPMGPMRPTLVATMPLATPAPGSA